MSKPPIPEDEVARMKALDRFGLRDMVRETSFDQLTQVTADVLDMPIALVTILDGALQCYAGAKGLDLGRTPREASFCAYTILRNEPMIVSDATRDDRFSDSPLVTGPPFIRFYAGVPLHAGGMRVGSLCVIDTKPREISEEALQRLEGLTRVGEQLLESRLDALLRAESETRLERFVEAMPAAMAVYDAESRFLMSNALYRELFFSDRNAEIPVGLSFPDLLERMERKGPAIRIKGDGGDWKGRRIALRASGVPDYEMCLAGNQWLHVREARLEGGELVATFADVTELKQRERALEERTALLRDTLESIDEGIAVFGRDGRLLACSDAYFDLLEIPAPLRELGTPIDATTKDLARRGFLGEGEPGDVAAQTLASLKRGASRRADVRVPNGKTLACTHTVAEDGRIIVNCRDVTERVEMERMKDEFVSTVSHELRTPLTSIAGSLGLLAGGIAGELPTRAAKLVDIARRNVDRLARLVNDLLDIDKIESGQIEFQNELVDLNAVVEQAVEQNRPYAERLGVRLECQTAREPMLVRGDLDRLLQIAANLISNAAKYSPSGETVTVASSAQTDRARLSVQDRGPGIPEHFRARLFRRFAQADASDGRAQQGSGLGLSIALAIVQRHSGSIVVDTRTGQGTTFHVDLPRVQHESQNERRREGPRVLVCEDDRSVGMALRQVLDRGGALVDVVGTTAEALERLDEQRYAALVLDLMLPDGNGLDLLRKLRARTESRDLPVVVVSAAADEARQSIAAGGLDVLDWITKPVDLPQLAAAVARCREPQAERRLRVLHVEDEDDTAHIVTLALSEFADVEVASDLRDARVRLAARSFDVAVLDLALPDGSGAELLTELAESPKGPIPVIIFSVSDAPEAVTEAVVRALPKSRTSLEQLALAIKETALRAEERK